MKNLKLTLLLLLFATGIGYAQTLTELRGAGLSTNTISTKVSNYTLNSNDGTILIDGSSNTVTLSLPSAIGLGGKIYYIKSINDTFLCDINPFGSQTIDGISTNKQVVADKTVTIQSDGSNWIIITREIAGLTDESIPRFDSSAQGLVDSSIKERGNNIIVNKKMKFNKGIETTAASIQIGESAKVGAFGGALILNDADNNEFTFAQTQLTLTGSSPTFTPVGLTTTVEAAQASDIQTQVISSVSWTARAVGDFTVSEFIFRATTNTTGLRLVVRENNINGRIITITEQDDPWNDGDGFSLNSTGDTTVVLPSKIPFFDGDVLHFTLEVATGTFGIKGDTVAFGGQPSTFVPFFSDKEQPFRLQLLADAGGFIKELTGDVAITSGTATVVGTSTLFLSELIVGQAVQIREESFTVLSITDNNNFTLSANHIVGAGVGIGGGLNAKVFSEDKLFTIKTFGGSDRVTVDKAGTMTIEEGLIVNGNLNVNGTTTTVNSETVNIKDNYVYINKDYTAFVAKAGGHVFNVLPENGTINVVTGGVITAAVAGTTDAKITLVNAFTYSTGDLIQISLNPTYDGIYEVAIHGAGVLEIKGIGASPNTLDFVQTDLVASASENMTIVKINATVQRAGVDGKMEQAFGKIASDFVFKDITTQSTALTSGSVLIADSNGDINEDNPNLFWDDINNRLGIGTTAPNALLEVAGAIGGSIGGFPSGHMHVRGNGTVVNSNAVITGHNSFNGNTQLWYLGSTSSSNNDIAFINRQNADLIFQTNSTEKLRISNTGVLSTPVDLDITTGTGGVFKFNSDAFRAGLDAVEYVEIGHGGGNGFINAVGDGGLDFRFEGSTLATFTDFGHLHLLTNVDQKHTLKIKTANNLSDTGIAWENSGGAFTGTIFRTDVGGNAADLIFATGLNTNVDLLTNAIAIRGGSGVEGNVEIFKAFRVNSVISNVTDPTAAQDAATKNYVDTQIGGGWTDDGTVVRLSTSTDAVSIGPVISAIAKVTISGSNLSGTNPALALHNSFGDGNYIDVGNIRKIGVFTGGNFFMGYNFDYDATADTYKRQVASEAAGIEFTTVGDVEFKTAPTGTVGSSFAATTQMKVYNAGGVTIGTTSINANAILEAVSTTKGFLIPRWTTTQETTNISSLGVSDAGLEWQNTTTGKHSGWNGTQLVVKDTPITNVERFTEDFELGNFNNWVVLNDATNQWFVGTPGGNGGGNGAFISNDGGTSSMYTGTASNVSHFYKDIFIPPNSTNLRLVFDWRGVGEPTAFDRGRIYNTPTSVTPVIGTDLGTVNQIGNANYLSQPTYLSNQVIVLGDSFAGQTRRFIFQWRNDGSVVNNPGWELDNIKFLVDGDFILDHSFVGMIMTDSSTQTAPAAGVKKAISLNTVKRNVGLDHGATLPATQMIIRIAGEYRLESIPQFVSGGGGAGKIELSWEKALAATPTVFVTIAGSPVSDNIASTSDKILACEIFEQLEVGDIVRAMWATNSTNINITAPTSLVGDIIPSVQQYIHRVGN